MTGATVLKTEAYVTEDISEKEEWNYHWDETKRLRMALRDLIWRVDHLRNSVHSAGDTVVLERAIELLDTSDARAVLGIK